MTKLYSYQNAFPKQLPFRIRLPNGFTRTDPNTFTEEEILLAGFVEVPEKPFVGEKKSLSWNYTESNWQVLDVKQEDESEI